MSDKKIVCAYCHSEAKNEFTCKDCKTIFHADCYEENGGCSVLGCKGFAEDKPLETPVIKKKNEEIPKKNNKTKNTAPKKKKSNALLVLTLTLILLPVGYAAAFNNLLYPLLPAVYKEPDIIKANSDGYKTGKAEGYEEGFDKGELSGFEEGYDKGELSGYEEGYDKGESVGTENGWDAGYDSGYNVGQSAGYSSGQSAGYSSGYSKGSKAGCQWVFDTLSYDRVVGYSYSYWSSNSYGNTYISRSQCG